MEILNNELYLDINISTKCKIIGTEGIFQRIPQESGNELTNSNESEQFWKIADYISKCQPLINHQ